MRVTVKLLWPTLLLLLHGLMMTVNGVWALAFLRQHPAPAGPGALVLHGGGVLTGVLCLAAGLGLLRRRRGAPLLTLLSLGALLVYPLAGVIRMLTTLPPASASAALQHLHDVGLFLSASALAWQLVLALALIMLLRDAGEAEGVEVSVAGLGALSVLLLLMEAGLQPLPIAAVLLTGLAGGVSVLRGQPARRPRRWLRCLRAMALAGALGAAASIVGALAAGVSHGGAVWGLVWGYAGGLLQAGLLAALWSAASQVASPSAGAGEASA